MRRCALLDELAAFCEHEKLRLAVSIPWYREFDRHAALLRDWPAPDGVVIVDLPALLATKGFPRDDYFMDPVHPNARGHELIARAIAARLHEAWR